MVIFKYKAELTSRKEKILRPVAEVFLKTFSDSWIKFYPYIDSGVDVTLIPLSLGKLLGFSVDESEVQQIGGIRGSVPVIFTQAFIKIGEEQFSTRLSWALIEDVPPLLGRTDVFDKFNITFKQSERIILSQKRL